jgi:hypothetical protein
MRRHPMAPILSDTATAIHSLTGRSPALDRLAEVVAADLIFVLLLPTVVLWLHEDGLRASVAIVLGAGMALAIGSLIGAWWFEPRPFVVDHFTPSAPAGWRRAAWRWPSAFSGCWWGRRGCTSASTGPRTWLPGS